MTSLILLFFSNDSLKDQEHNHHLNV